MNRLTFIVSLAMFFGPATVHAFQNDDGKGGVGSSECTYQRKLNADLSNHDGEGTQDAKKDSAGEIKF